MNDKKWFMYTHTKLIVHDEFDVNEIELQVFGASQIKVPVAYIRRTIIVLSGT